MSLCKCVCNVHEYLRLIIIIRRSLFVLRESKRTKQTQKNQVYIKKPLNAFMLFMKEQRPNVRPAISLQGSGAVSAFLGLVVSVALL